MQQVQPCAGAALLDCLDARLAEHLKLIENSPAYRCVESEHTSSQLATAVVREIMLEVFSYGPLIVEATFTAIGRWPKTRPDLMKMATTHILDEVDHCEVALRDYVQLGGNEQEARARRMSPAAFAMAATCKLLAERENPFAYLGFMYLFEALTPILSQRALQVLAQKNFAPAAQTFIDLHATEDIKHTAFLRGLITKVVRDYPGAAEAIQYGLECFACVWPLPVWEAAYGRAVQAVPAAEPQVSEPRTGRGRDTALLPNGCAAQ